MKAFVKCPAYVSLNAVGYLVPRTESPRQRLLLSLVRVRVWAPSVLGQTGLMKKSPQTPNKKLFIFEVIKAERNFLRTILCSNRNKCLAENRHSLRME